LRDFSQNRGRVDWNTKLWRQSCEQFQRFMVPITAPLGRSERRIAATHYVEGLLLPGKRKSIEPMAERLQFDGQRLQQFIKDSPWEDEAVWQTIRREVAPHLEPIEAWIVDETGWPKQGKHSVGVSHQYCGALGKQANCQVSVEIVISDGFVAAPMAGRLYLPEAWIADRPRCREAGVPEEVEFATKSQIALELLRQVVADEIDRAPVLGDSAYGDSYEFRQELRRLNLEFFLQVTPEEHKGWLEEVPTQLKGKYRTVNAKTAERARDLVQITEALPQSSWKDCLWQATGGRQRKTRLAWIEVYLMRGLKEPNGQLEKLWLVVDWPKGHVEPYHYYLAKFDRQPTKALCLKLSRSRWHVEQYFQRSKDDLGFDHYEGRSWRGFHHHLVMSAIAYLFILTVYLSRKKNFWSHVGEEPGSDPALAGAIDRMLSVLRNRIS
jgi:SRSO17 transposase